MIVFLSHRSEDLDAVSQIAKALQEREIDVWLDESELSPGDEWQKAIEKGLEASDVAIVFVGPQGTELEGDKQLALSFQRERQLLVIPLLLPGASFEQVPRFLQNITSVDFRDGLDNEIAFERLIWAITGKKPDALKALEELEQAAAPPISKKGSEQPSKQSEPASDDRSLIFFSYAREDSAFALKLAFSLKR